MGRSVLAVLMFFYTCPLQAALLQTISSENTSSLDRLGYVAVYPNPAQGGGDVRIVYANERWAGRNVFIHYGYNGWNYQTSGTGAGTDSILGNKNYFFHRLMQENDTAGEFEISFRIPEAAKALHYVFCVDECQADQWDNNQGMDFAEPLVFPYIGPILTWNQNTDPTTGVVISFEVGRPSHGWLEIGLVSGSLQRFPSERRARMLRFKVSELAPGSEYRYRVGDDRGRQSEWFRFRTLSANDGNLSILLFGDTQDDGERKSHIVLQSMAENHADVDFLLSTGDLAWNNGPGEWWTFFANARSLLAAKPIMTVVGNHDTPGNGSHPDASAVKYYFAQDYQLGDRAVQSRVVGPARFLLLNSEIPSDFQKDQGRQYLWLNERVRHPDDSTWTFALSHIPPFNAGTRHYGEQRKFKAMAELFTGNVDWHFAGHEHLYQRMLPVAQKEGRTESMARYGVDQGEGTGYLIVPSAGVDPNSRLIGQGASLFDRSLLAYPDVPLNVREVDVMMGYIRIDIQGSQFQLRTYAVSGEDGTTRVVDRIQYDKAGGL